VLAGTVSTAIEDTFSLHAMTDDPAMTVRARWRKRMYSALETIEHMGFAVYSDLKAFVIYVAAYLALYHLVIPHRAFILIHPIPLFYFFDLAA